MPSLRVIRKYNDMRDVVAHFVEISKSFKKRFKIKASDGKIIRVTPGVKGAPPKVKFSKTATNDIKYTQDTIHRLNEQNDALSNMILTLNTKFSSKDVPSNLIAALRKNIGTLQANIREAIKEENDVSEEKATKYAQEKTTRIANAVKKFMDAKFESKGKITLNIGVKPQKHPDPNDANKAITTLLPVIAAFITYTNIKNARREIEPSIVIAVIEFNNYWYIKPDLIKIPPMNQLKLGQILDADEKKAISQAIRYTQEQMVADSHLSAINPKNVPVTPEQVKLGDHPNVVRVMFNPTTIEVQFYNGKVKNREDAEEAAQDIYKKIYHEMKAANSRNRDRIVYEVMPYGKIWRAIYKFTTGDKYTGRALRDDEAEKLSEIFTPNELKEITKALNHQG